MDEKSQIRRLPMLLALFLTLLIAAGCSDAKKEPIRQLPELENRWGTVEVSFPFRRLSGVGGNQFAVWIEKPDGTFVRTLLVTRYTGSGGFLRRHDSIPTWVNASEIAERSDGIDAVTSATPDTGTVRCTWNCLGADGLPAAPGEYRFRVEGTVYWRERLLWTGTIVIGGADTEATATCEATPATLKSDMIGPVHAVYRPPVRK